MELEVPPKTIGRYEIQREIGRGAMGVVYEASDPALARTIALKTIKIAIAAFADEVESFEERFFAEARVAARLSHPGIVVVHDVGRDPQTGTLYIAMERLQGRNLADMIKDGVRFSPEQALGIVLRIAEALAHAHSHKVIHRDLKPANVVLLPSGDPKILDFGIAKVDTTRVKLTTHGKLFGTPLYMSPEQATGRTVDARSDLFSLGALAYNLLTGFAAFAAPTVTDILQRVVNDDPEPPSRIVPFLPAGVDGVIRRALAKDPDNRYPDARSMADDIRKTLGAPRPPDPFVPVPKKDAPKKPYEFGVATRPGGDLHEELQTMLTGLTPLPDETSASGGTARSSDHEPAAAASSRPSRWPLAVAGVVFLASAAAFTWLLFSSGIVKVSLPQAPAAEASPLPSARPWAGPSPKSVSSPPPAAAPSPVSSPATASPKAATPKPAAPRPSPSVAASAAAAAATSPAPPASTEAAGSRLAIDFDHPLREGTLQVWVDGRLSLDEDLQGKADRKLGIKTHKGTVDKTVAVRPGLRTVRVRVAWDDNAKEETVSTTFKAGEARRLEVRLGRLRKNLSVEWK